MVRGSLVQTHDLGERLVDVHIVALRGLRIVTEELRGRIVGGGAVTQRASLLDLVGNQGSDFVDGRDLRHVVRGRGCRGRGALRSAVRRAGRRRIRAGGERESSCGCEDDEGVCLRDGHDLPSDGSGPWPVIATIMHPYAPKCILCVACYESVDGRVECGCRQCCILGAVGRQNVVEVAVVHQVLHSLLNRLSKLRVILRDRHALRG